MDKIKLDNMQFYGYHGVFPEENKLGQQFYVDLELFFDLTAAGKSDKLEDSINYAEIHSRVKHKVENETFQLIEALAEAIASDLLHTYTKINALTVRVIKPHPPFDIHFDGVTVEIHRKQEML